LQFAKFGKLAFLRKLPLKDAKTVCFGRFYAISWYIETYKSAVLPILEISMYQHVYIIM